MMSPIAPKTNTETIPARDTGLLRYSIKATLFLTRRTQAANGVIKARSQSAY